MKDKLDKAKDIAQIVSLIAVPILVAVFGLLIQASMKNSEIKRDYVKIAVGILSNANADPSVKLWATRVLQDNSPTPFDSDAASKLASAFEVLAPIPPLPSVAKASSIEVPAICASGCSKGLSELLTKTADSLSERGEKGQVAGDIVDTLFNSLNELAEAGRAISQYADGLRIAGMTCEQAYDSLRK